MSGIEAKLLDVIKNLEEEKRLADKRAKQLYLAGGAGTFLSLTDTPADYTGQAGKFVKVNATPDALIFAAIAWADVAKAGSNLTDLATRQHAGLTDVTSDQHHAQLHAASHASGQGDELSHDALKDFVAAEHKSLPNTIAQVLSDHTKAAHDALNINADTCDGKHVAEASTVSTIAARNSSGDINARLFRSEYDTTNPTINYIMTQIDTASNNYIRPSTPAQLISALNLMTKAGGTFTGAVYASNHGAAATDMIVNVCYGTANPPSAGSVTEGALFIKYV